MIETEVAVASDFEFRPKPGSFAEILMNHTLMHETCTN